MKARTLGICIRSLYLGTFLLMWTTDRSEMTVPHRAVWVALWTICYFYTSLVVGRHGAARASDASGIRFYPLSFDIFVLASMGAVLVLRGLGDTSWDGTTSAFGTLAMIRIAMAPAPCRP